MDLGLDLGLTILNIRKRVLSYSFSELQENKILAWAFIVNSKTKHHLNSSVFIEIFLLMSKAIVSCENCLHFPQYLIVVSTSLTTWIHSCFSVFVNL